MPRRRQTKGVCTYCGEEKRVGQMTEHLSSCPKRQVAIAKAEHRKADREKLYYLRVQDAWGGGYWLDLEMRGTAKLKSLDQFLRAIWLECCGHLSRFSLGGWEGEEIAKARTAEEVFNSGVTLTHIYDFGTSSMTLIQFVESREGKPTTRHPLGLMARNVQPAAKCIECKQPAAWLCIECVIEDRNSGYLCQEHVESHPHDEYGEPFRIVNSPRLGMCGYQGPADPPY
jgi:hypothetical protein